MAYENLQLAYPNFCTGPVIGTFCSIDLSSVTTVMKLKNDTGAILAEYSLSSNIINDVVCLEYVGPRNLTAMQDNLTFFTVEKVSTTTSIIKRWETRVSNLTLNLKQQIIKSSTGTNRYDINAACVEYYDRTLSANNQGGINYLDINSSSRVVSGTRLILGPSTDSDNIGAIEYVTVNYVVGIRVYLTTNTQYQYILGDRVTFYNNIYAFSGLGYNGATDKGSLFKLNLINGGLEEVVFDGLYQKISASRWNQTFDSVCGVCGTNMLMIAPYQYYQNIKSMSLNNVESSKTSVYTIHDIAFSGNTLYKLANKVTLKSDSGVEATTDWSPLFNYREDSLLPYTNSIKTSVPKLFMIGQEDGTDIAIKVTDQFGVGLLNVPVTVSISSGDPLAALDPVDGQVTTDANGNATVGYTSGTIYQGATEISVKASGGSPSSGSAWVWEKFLIHSGISHNNSLSLFQQFANGQVSYSSYLCKQIAPTKSIQRTIFCKTYFTSPGGGWINPSSYSSEAISYLPYLPIGYQDGPVESFRGWVNEGSPGKNNLITQVLTFESERQLMADKELVSELPTVRQISEASHTLQMSQLKSYLHTNWVDGVAYSYLFTNTAINQFVFVEDAIPVFWSVKNPKETNIWIRLRPYAFDLNPNSLKFYVREVSYEEDTGYVDMSQYLTVTTFDAGGGLDGLDVLCDPPNDFHYNSTVFVKIEVYDLATEPNFIWLDYWFFVIPDYRYPYLDNLNPAREQNNVEVDSPIYFEIKDEGVGVDITTFEMTVNSRLVSPTIEKVNDNFYKVTYSHIDPFFNNKEILVNVKVADSSDYQNYLNDSYRFYTPRSSNVWFTNFEPRNCFRGASKFSSIRLLILGANDGVDRDTIKLQILNYDKTNEANIIPVIYRIS